MGSGKSGSSDRQLVDVGLAGESLETADTEDIRGRVSASTLTDAGDIGENSGEGLFFACGGGHNVRLQSGAAKLVEGTPVAEAEIPLSPNHSELDVVCPLVESLTKRRSLPSRAVKTSQTS
jgi:hypothetical protein